MTKETNRYSKGLFSPKILGVIASLGLMLSFSAEEAKAFSDVPETNWAYDEISLLASKGIINGYSDGTFQANVETTRLQAVIMLLKAKNITDFENLSNPGFADIQPGDYGYEEVAKAVELGIINGTTNSKGEKIFNPSDTVTRSQMAKILVLAYNLEGQNGKTFSDLPTTHWAYEYVQILSANQITTGYDNGAFGVNDSITRGQFAVMVARTLDEEAPAVEPKTPVVELTPSVTEPKTPVTPPVVEPKRTGKTYPDGWVAPALNSYWSPNHETNLATLQNELGFKDGGLTYGVTDDSEAITIAGSSADSPTEVTINFNLWLDNAIYESYRIPIVATELLKIYFGKDAPKVFKYVNTRSVPDTFTANGRKVTSAYDSNSGALTLTVGRK